jgi:hypothetical protein
LRFDLKIASLVNDLRCEMFAPAYLPALKGRLGSASIVENRGEFRNARAAIRARA